LGTKKRSSKSRRRFAGGSCAAPLDGDENVTVRLNKVVLRPDDRSSFDDDEEASVEAALGGFLTVCLAEQSPIDKYANRPEA
jgi:hypothetical protein